MTSRCAGCGQSFATAEGFNLHATGQRAPEPDAIRRCRFEDELRLMGFRKLRGSAAWHLSDRANR